MSEMVITAEYAELMKKLSKGYRAKPVKSVRCLEMPGDFVVDGESFKKGDYLVFKDDKYFGLPVEQVNMAYEEIVRNRVSKVK